MCKCTPGKRTPFCGKPGCEWPPQKIVPVAATPTIAELLVSIEAYEFTAQITVGSIEVLGMQGLVMNEVALEDVPEWAQLKAALAKGWVCR